MVNFSFLMRQKTYFLGAIANALAEKKVKSTIVYVPEYGMTTGQMEPEAKNAISHRGKALEMMKEKLGYESFNC